MASLPSVEEQLREAQIRNQSRERLLEGENEVLKLIIERAPLSTVLESLTRVAERHGSYGMLCSILLLDSKGVQLRHGAAPSLPAAYNKAIDGIQIGPAVGSCGTAAYLRKRVIVKDIATDPLWAEFKDLAMAHGLRACWSTPILSSRNGVLGTFAVYYREVREPDSEDFSVIQMLARTAALAIEHTEAERKLADSEERFRSLSRCSPAGIFTVDVDGTFTYVNPRFREISAFDYEKSLEFWLENAVEASRRKAITKEWSESARNREEFAREFRLTQGSRWVSLRCAPMSSSAGEHIGYAGTLEDVTKRVEALAQVRHEAAFRKAIEESFPAGIAAIDADGIQTYVNPAFVEMVGWPAEELLGAKAPFVYWPREQIGDIEQAFEATMEGRSPREGFEVKFRRRNGELFYALVTVAQLTDDAGVPAGWVASVVDVTAKNQKRLSKTVTLD